MESQLMKKKLKKVISASRRIDMVACFPDETADLLLTRCPTEKVHSLVFWTKDAANLILPTRLRETALKYSQLFIHFTVTGLGGTMLETRVPNMETTLKQLPGLIELVGNPDLIRFRFDPIIHLIDGSGNRISNLHLFEKIAPEVARVGIKNISISWMSLYPKVLKRLKGKGYSIDSEGMKQKSSEIELLNKIAGENDLVLHFCSDDSLPKSSCIDGKMLNHLHPHGEICSEKPAKGQRKLCGCTESWDIGWYFKCKHGCLYCYANPMDY
jgi:hypothetical protein